MKIEEFKDIKIAYMRRVGKYGLENKHLMETFKAYLKAKGLLKKDLRESKISHLELEKKGFQLPAWFLCG